MVFFFTLGGKVLLDWILGKLGGRLWTGCIWLGTGTSGGLLGNSNAPLSSVGFGEFLDWLAYSWLLWTDSFPWSRSVSQFVCLFVCLKKKYNFGSPKPT
jgi:hypothetical protein